MTALVWKRKGEENGQSVNEKNGVECFFSLEFLICEK